MLGPILLRQRSPSLRFDTALRREEGNAVKGLFFLLLADFCPDLTPLWSKQRKSLPRCQNDHWVSAYIINQAIPQRGDHKSCYPSPVQCAKRESGVSKQLFGRLMAHTTYYTGGIAYAHADGRWHVLRRILLLLLLQVFFLPTLSSCCLIQGRKGWGSGR